MKPLYPRELRSFSIAVAVAVTHLTTAILVLWGGAPVLSITPLAALSHVVGNNLWVAFFLIGASVFALTPFVTSNPSRWAFAVYLFPQQMLLLTHLVAVVMAIISGHYPDGYVPMGGGIFIAADQIWLLTVVFFHTLEYAEVI